MKRDEEPPTEDKGTTGSRTSKVALSRIMSAKSEVTKALQ